MPESISPTSRVALDLQQVATQFVIPHDILGGVQAVELTSYTNDVVHGMALSLRGYVMHEQAGETVTERVDRTTRKDLRVTLPVKPWWLPRFLWRRMPWREACFTSSHSFSATLTATPRWSYPSANIQVSALGRPVGKVEFNVDSSYGALRENW